MKTNFFKKLFSIPDYLSLSVAGIEICDRSIKYIEFFNKNGFYSVKNYGEIFIPSNTVKGGDILDKKALISALIEVKKKISSDFVKVSISEDKTYIFDVQIPREAVHNLKEVLEFKIEENVPLKLEESSFEYEIVEDKKTFKNIVVNVSVIPKRIISDYSYVFDQAGIYPIAYEIESKMVADSVIRTGDTKNSIIMDIKDNSTLFIGVINGFVRITSSLLVGENLIKENLFKTGLFENEEAVNKFFENDFSFETIYAKEAYSSLANIFSILKDEVEKFDKYIVSKFPNTDTASMKKIDSIILCGKCSSLLGLSKHINQNIKTEVVLANAWTNVTDINKSIPGIKFNDSLNFVATIGLVVSSNKQDNA